MYTKKSALIKYTLVFLCICFCVNFSFGQISADYVRWSATKKLTIDDFSIKTKANESTIAFAQFYMEYQLKGFDFLTKNFNKKVHNYMIKSASWIDTTANINQAIIYEQTLFDLSEIYARTFRKELKENRKKLVNGLQIAEELNAKIMADFSKRRIEYDLETKFGTDVEQQKAWEKQIQKELLLLEEFAYDK